jgi:hypothetical protein
VGHSLTPWSFRPLWSGLGILFVLFFVVIAVLMILHAPALEVTVVSKLLVIVLAIAGVGGAVSTFMWGRYWREVQWDGDFWAFVAGAAPEYEEAQGAWRWGRRFVVFWVVILFSVAAISLIEIVAGNWR